jgi:eukaryotic-like serine/threonine-protein kinase
VTVLDSQGVLAGRYELHRLIGRGGMAEVFEGYDRLLDRTVAVKMVPRGRVDTETTERVRREARAVAALNHPNVVALHDLVLGPRDAFLVLELLDGPTLAQHVRERSRLPAPEACQIAAQVCAGLAAAHRRGLVHRDISPGNIVLTRSGTVKLTDFGIAHGITDAFVTGEGQVSGTPPYMSPEQIRGAELDGSSDLYSLGCCLYLMLTGRPPFVHATAAEIATAHLREHPDPPRTVASDVPPEVNSTVLRALAKRPADRFPDAETMRAALTAPSISGAELQLTRPLTSTEPPTVADTIRPDTGISPAGAQSAAKSASDAGGADLEELAEGAVPGILRRRVGVILVLLAVTALLVALPFLLTG